jgi:Mg2+ and Co2+ transporter CorA
MSDMKAKFAKAQQEADKAVAIGTIMAHLKGIEALAPIVTELPPETVEILSRISSTLDERKEVISKIAQVNGITETVMTENGTQLIPCTRVNFILSRGVFSKEFEGLGDFNLSLSEKQFKKLPEHLKELLVLNRKETVSYKLMSGIGATKGAKEARTLELINSPSEETAEYALRTAVHLVKMVQRLDLPAESIQNLMDDFKKALGGL